MIGPRNKQWKGIVITAVLTLIVVIVFLRVEHFLGSTSFCLSCHSMTYNDKELKESTHYGALGVNPECRDCHLPPGFFGEMKSHLFDGARSVLGEFRHDLSTVEKFNEHRAEFAHNARINLKKWNCSTCRKCHKNPQPASASAMAAHKKMETEGATCIDCHQNLVHRAVPEEDLNAGLREGKIVLKPEKVKKE